MEKAEVEALLEELKTGIIDTVTGLITEANKGTAASLQRDLKKLKAEINKKPESSEETDSEKTVTDPQMSVLKTELDNLKAQLEAEQQEKLRIQKEQALSALVATKKFASPELVKDALKSRFGDSLVNQNGDWFIQKGENNFTKLSDEFEQFAKSDEGKKLILFEGAKGSGVDTTRGSKPPTEKVETNDPGQMLLSVFGSKTQ